MTPKTDFQSVTVTLTWESNDWKLEGSSSTNGLVAPIDVRQASNVPGDFSGYAPAAAEDPVLSGSANQDGSPAPYGRDERGARAAAVSATMLYGDPRFFVSEDWRHRMLAATAASNVLHSVTSDTDSTARLVMENRGVGADGRTADGSELITRTAALATRSISYSDQAASIELWTASVGGVAGKDETQRPQVAFLRVTVDLVWEDGDWKTTAVTPSGPLVPSPPAMQEADPADSFAAVGVPAMRRRPTSSWGPRRRTSAEHRRQEEAPPELPQGLPGRTGALPGLDHYRCQQQRSSSLRGNGRRRTYHVSERRRRRDFCHSPAGSKREATHRLAAAAIVSLKSLAGRGRLGHFPYAAEYVGNLGPDQLTSILDRVDLIGQGPEDNELVGDDPAGPVLASQGIRETQRPLLGNAPPDFRLVPDTREGFVVDLEWIPESPVTEKPETPGPPSRGPDEAHLTLLRKTCSSSPLSRSIRKRVNVAVR
ncbi:hypothetical protein [Streptomyces sp. NPDC060322]|uniref:hypothetical protein n=1 Tax=Streptomyces sp. NPDC060322 TaxID=3347097 RepID=UPI003667B953